MSASENGAANSAEVACGRSLTIAAVGELYPSLRNTLAAGAAVTIDVSSVDTIDAAGLQLLLTYQQDSAAQQMNVTWRNPSEALRQAAATMGVTQQLGW